MSSLKDLASLIMVPSLYKDGELHTVKPLGNSILHPDATGNHDGTDGSTPAEGNFTFSRGSNLAATRVDVNGLIEKGRENLITYSNEFDNASGWTQYSGYTLTSGQADKDGGTNAWKWESTQSGTAQINNVHNQTGMVTHSIYAKAGNIDVLKIWVGVTAEFNLSTGVASHSQSKMTDVGNGWWRCEIFSPYTRFNPFFSPTASGQYLYIQDAQAEQGLVATDYIETGASTAQSGILEDMPRLDYSGGASCPALLLEPQRTNLLPQSEYVGSSVWTKDNAAVSDNSAISPEGVQNASLVYPVSSSSTKWGAGTYDFNSASNDTYTNSIYVKSNGWRWVYMIDPSGLKNAWFDLQNGVTGTAESPCTSSIEPLGNDWFRCSVSSNITHTYTYCGVYFSDADNSYVCTPNGTSGAYVYGSQSEAGSYPTSYIPTYGSSVTRSRDTGSLNMIDAGITTGWTSATLFIEYEKPNTGESVDTFRMHGTSSNGRAYIYNTGNGFAYDWGISGGHTLNTNTKVVWRLDSLSEGTRFKNGAKENSGSGTAWSDIRYMYLNNQGLGGTLKIKQIALFPTALTDSECIALTTL